MNSISHTFDGHIVDKINALYGSLVFISLLVVETGHSVIEVGYVGEAHLEGSTNIAVFGIGMCNTGQHTLLRAILAELQGARQLGRSIPTGQTG